MSKVSIIIPCKNEGIYIKQTLDFMFQTEAKYLADIIVIDDASNDNCCEFLKNESKYYHNVSLIQASGIGPSAARNLGANLATSAEILVFCDAHITMKQNWLFTILSCFKDPSVSAICPGIGGFHPNSAVGYGQTWNDKFEIYWLKQPESLTEIPLAPGGCMFIRKQVFDAVGGFDAGFRSWGYEDVALSIKLWLFDYKIFVHPSVRIGHKFRKTQPYNVDLTEFHYNKLRMVISHFNHHRIHKVLMPMHEYSNFEKIKERLLTSDTYKQRIDYFNRRVHDDDWFFNKFNIPF